MREILFRGKTPSKDEYFDDGEWVQGFYTCFNGKEHRIYSGYAETDCGDYYPDWCNVIPETVGQFTGLTDKNGKKIFEGDIVRTQPFSDRPYSKKAKFKQHIGVVEYYIRRHNLREQDYEAGWQVKIKDYGGYGCCDWSAFFQCEVIGNIFENADLLEG